MRNVPDYIQTEDKSFLRDTRSHALLNTDRAALERNRAQRTKAVRQQTTIQTLQHDVAALTTLVQQLLDRDASANSRHN